MQLERVLLLNIGPHRRLELNLRSGLTGICGKNGSGKSSILSAIVAGISNKWDRFAGVKASCILDTADPTEESSVTLDITHNGTRFSIYRQLRRGATGRDTAHELIIEGQKPIRKDADIAEALETKLKIKTKLLDRFVFVAQGQLCSFLTQTPGDRAAVYQYLCGTTRAAEILKAADTLATQDQALVDAEPMENIDQLRRQLLETQNLVDGIEATIQAETVRLLSSEKLAQAKTLLARRQEWERLSTQTIPTAEARLTRRLDALTAAGEVIRDAATRYAILQDQFELQAPLAALAQTAFSQLTQHRQQVKQAATIKQQLESAEMTLKTAQQLLHETALSPADAQRDNISNELLELQQQQGMAQRTLKTFEAGPAACPTCGTPAVDLGPRLQAMRAEFKRRETLITKRQAQLKEIDAARWAVAKADSDYTVALGAVKRLEQRLVDFGPTAFVSGDAATLKKTIDDFTTLTAQRDTAGRTAAAAKAKHDAEAENVREAEQDLAEAQKQLKASVVTDELIEKVTKALARHQDATTLLAVAQQRFKDLSNTITTTQKALDAAEARQARSARARDWLEKLQALQTVFHRQALPQLVAAMNLQDVEATINANLEMFGSPFWVTTTPDLSFTVHFPSQLPCSALRLSGGQQAILALAFRPAMGTLFDSDLGLLVLDEASAHLDDDNLTYLAQALTQYAQQIRGRRQILVTSHSPLLRPAFDQVIDLDALTTAV